MMQQEKALHKKRFGQYFSGKAVASMLFSLLPKDYVWDTAVDPMAGIGDMLVAVRENAVDCPQLLGVEIDRTVIQKCLERLPEAKVLCCDAFKCNELISQNGFDLVITNPPYVRYQLQAMDDGVMPSAGEIRKNLTKQIERITYLSKEEKQLFLKLAKNYSGFADMAVPAWILCAALVRKSGYLAVVVPETWLNRDYASPIHYLLLKLFHVETVMRDTNASWFQDAIVKTCLVVAKRVEMRTLLQAEELITRIVETDREYLQPTITLFPHIRSINDMKKWLIPEDKGFLSNRAEIPYELTEIIGKNGFKEYTSLSKMGIDCGQGLRTGANEFFYVEIEKDEGKTVLVRSRSWDHGGKEYRFEKADIIPALRTRADIDGVVVSPDIVTTGVVYPQGEVRGALRDYIISAEDYRDAKGRQFKELSAVSPNEKKLDGKVVREWYRLPKMTKRHTPNLCITRVSYNSPECLYIEQSEMAPIVIDANMVTLWGEDLRTIRIGMAILNSIWSKLSLELVCTVMGGGALKIEASHMKKLILPKLSDKCLDELESAGSELIAKRKVTDDIQEKIDLIVLSELEDKTVLQRMRKHLSLKINERSTRT